MDDVKYGIYEKIKGKHYNGTSTKLFDTIIRIEYARRYNFIYVRNLHIIISMLCVFYLMYNIYLCKVTHKNLFYRYFFNVNSLYFTFLIVIVVKTSSQ